MKVYLFDVKSGIYEGEDFCDAMEAREEEGITAKAPPEHKPGQIRVYDRNVGTWKLVPADLWAKVNGHE
jgi:hypothetical protein